MEDPDEESSEGYPSYSPDEDIYGKFHKTRDTDDESTFKHSAGSRNMKDFDDDMSGDDLDIPGSELDDDLEIVGNEDEENNYYSLGGDNHDDQEDDYNY